MLSPTPAAVACRCSLAPRRRSGCSSTTTGCFGRIVKNEGLTAFFKGRWGSRHLSSTVFAFFLAGSFAHAVQNQSPSGTAATPAHFWCSAPPHPPQNKISFPPKAAMASLQGAGREQRSNQGLAQHVDTPARACMPIPVELTPHEARTDGFHHGHGRSGQVGE